MDYRHIFSDPQLKNELLDRLDEIRDAVAATGALESTGALEGMLDVDRTADAVDRMNEGTWRGGAAGSDLDDGLEAIILRFTRPVYLVRKGTFADAPDGFPHSELVTGRMESGRPRLEAAVPSVGRVDLRNHTDAWVGTGWMVAPGLAVTNRHVAHAFADRQGHAFPFRTIARRRVHATLDWYHEYQRPEESRFRVTEVVWIEPDESLADVALLRIAESGEDGEPQPAPLVLADDADERSAVGRWVGVIGYPGTDGRADGEDSQRIFDGIYNHKRLAPGQVTAVERGGWIFHDATTLGGNSGSPVVDLETGRALALHFGGWPGERNCAVRATDVARLVARHAR